jgi:hypothetical protein
VPPEEPDSAADRNLVAAEGRPGDAAAVDMHASQLNVSLETVRELVAAWHLERIMCGTGANRLA